ncbi:DoxX family protein [Halobacterium litoreum]|uniref:DoxX family protein n=1 Tax=Halobacterium litoreum TaxID=2039234 RepID=A0ABD5NIA2_9EURY|nr:DoxX family protein [Halobacterium litoreum]UHH12447.1 DoxX family protein [Halobacterium litoreum]
MATGLEDVALLAARVLFGGVLAFMGVNHFMQTEQMTGYAQHKGLPAPKLSVLASGAVLVLGGLAVVTGAFPAVGAVALAAFLLASAVTMHDFWAVPEDQQQDEMTSFLKNVALAGGALAFAAIASSTWAYSAGLSAF